MRSTVFFFIFIVSGLYAQKYNFSHYGVDDGLIQSQVKDFYQDDLGYLWMCTHGGVSRFDGIHFKSWDKDDGMLDAHAVCVSGTGEGDVLVGTREGLMVFKGEKFEMLRTDQGLPANFIWSMLRDEDRVWIATVKGLCYYQHGSIHPSDPLFDNDSSVCRGLAGGGDYPIYVQSGGKIYYLNDNVWDNIVYESASVIDMTMDQDGGLWIGNWSEDYLTYYKDGKYSNYNDFIKGPVTSLHVDSKNRVWVSTWDEGMYMIPPENRCNPQNYSIKNGLTSNSYWAVSEDDEGNIWFGSFGGGIYKFKEDPFIHYTKEDGLNSVVVNTLMADSKGRLWVGTDNGMMVGKPLPDHTIEWLNGPWIDAFSGQKVVSFCERKNGDIAIGCYGNHQRMTILNKDKLISYHNRVPSSVFCILERSDGTLLAGTDNGGIFKSGPDGDEVLRISYGGNRVINLYEDVQNRVWISTYGAGINVLIGDSIHAFNEGRLKSVTVAKCIEGFDGETWIGTEDRGIYMVKLNAENHLEFIDSLNTNNGSIHNRIEGIRKDDQGRMWVGTGRGFMIIDKQNDSLLIRKYGKEEGFNLGECTFDAFAAINDKMYIGTSAGITAMSVGVEERDPPANRMSLIDLQLEYESLTDIGSTDPFGFPEKLTFNYDQNHLTFIVGAIHMTNPDKVRYSFFLEGLDEKWSPEIKDGKITYSSIPPGDYKLKVMSLIEGHETGVEKEIILIIEPPFWQTTSFYSIVSFGSIFLLFGLYRWRTAKIRKDKALLEKIVGDRTYELRLQKEIVEEKNREITDSITYAKRIQSAILPPFSLIEKYLPNAFILYKPKDIVAGDFYWMHIITPADDQTSKTVLFAVADCTGHGVPGAMVSVVCNNALNRAVREFGLTDPGKILDKTREIVITEFEKSEEDVKDGMDIALCSLDLQGLQDLGGLSAKGDEDSKPPALYTDRANALVSVKYAGAHNPLWVIRKDSGTIEEFKPNKQPIGKFENSEPYTTHELELNEGDSFYIFTDGFADQFGGDKGKKFKAAQFKELLASIQGQPIQQQKDTIEMVFEQWKGNLEQLDDVCIFGFRI